MTFAPYLSVVMTTRNDDHGGGIACRMRHCFVSLAAQAERLKLPMELLIVEWNPPSDRAPLAEAGLFPPSNDWLRTRIITVPPDYHAALPNANKLPLFQYLAKNVGIRRADAPFVLCSNVDVILSPPLGDWLARREITEGFLYRVDRWDVALADVDPGISEDERQQLCATRLTKANMWLRTFRREALEAALAPAPLSSFDMIAIAAKVVDEESRRTSSEARWHTNACGDFTLMSRDDWLRVRGYPEWPIHSWSTDSIMMARARTRGIDHRYLGAGVPIYHIDHDFGWADSGFNAEGLSFPMRRDPDGAFRIEANWHALPRLTHIDVVRIENMFRNDPDIEYNTTDGWGALDVKFNEAVLP